MFRDDYYDNWKWRDVYNYTTSNSYPGGQNDDGGLAVTQASGIPMMDYMACISMILWSVCMNVRCLDRAQAEPGSEADTRSDVSGSDLENSSDDDMPLTTIPLGTLDVVDPEVVEIKLVEEEAAKDPSPPNYDSLPTFLTCLNLS